MWKCRNEEMQKNRSVENRKVNMQKCRKVEKYNYKSTKLQK